MTTTHPTKPHRRMSTTPKRSGTDFGATVLDVLVMVVIVGIVAGGSILAFSSMSVEAAGGCDVDEDRLDAAANWYLAERGSDTIVATRNNADRFERTLVDGGFLRSPSTFHDIDAFGAVTPQENSPC